MSNKNLLLLLATLVVLVNYSNYLLPDRDKLHRTKTLLEANIAKERRLNRKRIDPKRLRNPYADAFFDGKRHSYSQAMGALQNMVGESAKGLCEVKRIRWAQVPASGQWYDRLKLQLSLECHPDNVFAFVDALHRSGKLLYTEHFRVTRVKGKNALSLVMDLVAFRSRDEAEK